MHERIGVNLGSDMVVTEAIPRIRGGVATFPFDDGTANQSFLISYGDRNWKVSPIVMAVLQYIDGKRDAKEIQHLLLNEHGVRFTVAEVEQIVIKIRHNGLLDESGSVIAPTKRRMLWGKIPIFSAVVVQKLSFLKLLFKKQVLTALIILAIVFLAFIFVSHPISVISNEITNLSFLNLVLVYALTLLFGVIHEFGHSVALISGGQKPGRIGLGVYYFMPVLFSDVTNAWRLNRAGRILVDIGGMYFQCLILLLTFILNVVVFHSQLVSLAISLSAFQVVLNFSPFIKLDGYWVLCDFLGVASVYETVRNLILSPFSKKARISFLAIQIKKRVVVCVYTILLVIFCVYFGDLMIRTCFLAMQTLLSDVQMLMMSGFNANVGVASVFSYIFSRVTHLIVIGFLIRLIILIPQYVAFLIKRKQIVKNANQSLGQVGNCEND